MLRKTHILATNVSVIGDAWPSSYTVHYLINSLTPGRDGNNFEIIIFELIYRIDILGNSYEIFLCRQATSH